MDVRTTYTNRGRRSMTHEGYMYRFERELKSSDISWRCTTKNCNARLRTDSSQNHILQSRGEHSHSQDDRKLERSQLRSQVKRKAAEDISQRPSKIIKTQLQDFNETCLHPNDLKSCSKAIYRVRRKSYPTIPKSIQEVHEALDRHNMMTTKEENFLQANNSELGYIIFTCTENLKCLSSVSEIFMDGTFKCAPRFFTQLYTIHGYKNGNYVPLVFILLSSKSEDMYRIVLRELVSITENKGLQFNPAAVHVDFEESVIKVVKEIFPTTSVKCCRFHLGQAWWRKIQREGLSKECKDIEGEVGKWLHKVYGLAFLSTEEIEDAFVSDLMNDLPQDSRCVKFADYLTEYYVTSDSRFPPVLWGEEPSYNKRTTNGPESFHAHYNEQFYSHHPSIFVFLEVIFQQQIINYIKIRYIDEPARLQKQETEKIETILQNWRKYQQQEISRSHFMQTVGFKYRARTDL